MRRRSILVVLALVAAAGLFLAGRAWYQSRLHIFTDDAYVESSVAPVSAKIPGQVVAVLVRDNEAVTAGQVLARLDDRDYRAKADQARAAVLIAQRRFVAADARVALGREMAAGQRAQASAASIRADAAKHSARSVLEATRATAQARRAALASAVAERDRASLLHALAVRELERTRELFGRELVARQLVDHAETEAHAAAAQLAAATERVSQGERDLESAEADARMREAGYEPQQIGLRTAEARAVEATAAAIQAEALQQEVRVREAERELAQAQLKQSEADLAVALLDLEYTQIRAPMDGLVSRKTVEVGQVLQAGQPLLAIVGLHDVWVLANFKETQLRRVRPGMRAEVVVDSFPDRTYVGSVDSISAGTGSRFSLLPPENATGNWVKVVQRVAVKIVLDPNDTTNPHTLRAGMSAGVTIHLRDGNVKTTSER